MPEILQRGGGGFANPGFTLGLANTALASNVTLGPWIHVQSDVSHFAPIPLGARLTVEARIEDLFEKRGHEFVDLDVGVFLDPDQPALRARHRAIYVLREPAE
jgi:predicted thioesterase